MRYRLHKEKALMFDKATEPLMAIAVRRHRHARARSIQTAADRLHALGDLEGKAES